MKSNQILTTTNVVRTREGNKKEKNYKRFETNKALSKKEINRTNFDKTIHGTNLIQMH